MSTNEDSQDSTASSMVDDSSVLSARLFKRQGSSTSLSRVLDFGEELEEGAVGPTTRRQWKEWVTKPKSPSRSTSVSVLSHCALRVTKYMFFRRIKLKAAKKSSVILTTSVPPNRNALLANAKANSVSSFCAEGADR